MCLSYNCKIDTKLITSMKEISDHLKNKCDLRNLSDIFYNMKFPEGTPYQLYGEDLLEKYSKLLKIWKNRLIEQITTKLESTYGEFMK